MILRKTVTQVILKPVTLIHNIKTTYKSTNSAEIKLLNNYAQSAYNVPNNILFVTGYSIEQDMFPTLLELRS